MLQINWQGSYLRRELRLDLVGIFCLPWSKIDLRQLVTGLFVRKPLENDMQLVFMLPYTCLFSLTLSFLWRMYVAGWY